MGDHLWADIPSCYLRRCQLGKLSLAFFRVAKSSTSLNWLWWRLECHLCRVACNTEWSRDFSSGEACCELLYSVYLLILLLLYYTTVAISRKLCKIKFLLQITNRKRYMTHGHQLQANNIERSTRGRNRCTVQKRQTQSRSRFMGQSHEDMLFGGIYVRHLANTIERYVLGGDAGCRYHNCSHLYTVKISVYPRICCWRDFHTLTEQWRQCWRADFVTPIRRFADHTNAYGTVSVKMQKTRRKISADTRIFVTVYAGVFAVADNIDNVRGRVAGGGLALSIWQSDAVRRLQRRVSWAGQGL